MGNQILGFFNENRWASNFHEHPTVTIYIDGYAGQKIACRTIEHAFQALKTVNMEDRFAVANAKDKHGNFCPAAAKKAGRKVTLRADWEQIKNDIMLELLVQKFSHDYYRDLLIATGTAYLEETNTWDDIYWGVCNGIGQNWLGKLLMQIREVLK